MDGDSNLPDEGHLPNDRVDEVAEKYADGEAAIEASGHCRPVYEMLELRDLVRTRKRVVDERTAEKTE